MCETVAETIRRGIETWGSHVPVLRWAVEETDGPILEVGSGFYSTPYLAQTGRVVVTIEDDDDWAGYQRQLYDHHIAGSLDDLNRLWRWGVVFVDSDESIFDRLARFDGLKFDVGVVHDHPEANWSAGPEAEYRAAVRGTTIFSDTVDVTRIREEVET